MIMEYVGGGMLICLLVNFLEHILILCMLYWMIWMYRRAIRLYRETWETRRGWSATPVPANHFCSGLLPSAYGRASWLKARERALRLRDKLELRLQLCIYFSPVVPFCTVYYNLSYAHTCCLHYSLWSASVFSPQSRIELYLFSQCNYKATQCTLIKSVQLSSLQSRIREWAEQSRARRLLSSLF